MGLRAYASAVLLGGALVAGPLACSRSGGAGAIGSGGLGGESSGMSGAAGTSVTGGSSGTTGASGTSGSSATAGASGAAGRGETTGTGGPSVGGAGGAAGTGGSGGGTGGGAGIGSVSGSGGQPPSGDDGGADSGPTDAGLDGPVCTPGLSCRPVNSCRTGTTSCTTGNARCVETGYQPNGTACGVVAECLNGICNTHECEVRACTPSNPCHTGTFSCVTGIPACNDTGALIPDGTRCGADKACLSGDCVACSASDAGCSNP